MAYIQTTHLGPVKVTVSEDAQKYPQSAVVLSVGDHGSVHLTDQEALSLFHSLSDALGAPHHNGVTLVSPEPVRASGVVDS